MAARLLDHFMTLRTAVREARPVAAAVLNSQDEAVGSAGRLQLLDNQEVEALLAQDARYLEMKTCLVDPKLDLAQAEQRAWDLSQALAADYPPAHPWSLLMVALRGALNDENAYDSEVAASIDDLETYGVLLWANGPGDTQA